MSDHRRAVLVALLAAIGLVAAALLERVLATVFFGVTLATVLVPLYQWLRRRGLPRWWASAVATLTALLAAVALVAPIGIVLYLRRGQLLALLASLPDRLTVGLAEFSYVVDVGEATAVVGEYLAGLAIGIVRASPEIAAHVTVLGFVVFGLLYGRARAHRALLRPVPDGYHDVVNALYERTRDTLFALYVIQAATALATFAIAFLLFWLLGYPYPVTMAVIAGILQFLPVVGPSLLVVALAAYEAAAGSYTTATAVLVLGLPLVAFLPDAVLRPRLARETAGLPASLYFVGFTGGVLSVGPVGIIAGPLVLALLAETLLLLARERPPRPTDAEGATDDDGPPEPPPE